MAVRNRLKEEIDSRRWSKYRFWKETKLARVTAYRLIDDPSHNVTAEVIDSVCRALNIQPGEWLQYIPDEESAA